MAFQMRGNPPLLFPKLWQVADTIPCLECGSPILYKKEVPSSAPTPQWNCSQHEDVDPRLPFRWPLFYRSLAFPGFVHAPYIIENGQFPVDHIVGDNWSTKYTQGWLEAELQRENRSVPGGYPRPNKAKPLYTGDFEKEIPPTEISVFMERYGYVGEGNHRLFVARMRGIKSIPKATLVKYDYVQFLSDLREVRLNLRDAQIQLSGFKRFDVTSAAELERLHTLWWKMVYGGYPKSLFEKFQLLKDENHPWKFTWMPPWMSFKDRLVRALYFVGILNSIPDKAIPQEPAWLKAFQSQ